MEKKTNKAKLEILHFKEKKIGAFYGNSIIIHLLGYFCMQNSYLR